MKTAVCGNVPKGTEFKFQLIIYVIIDKKRKAEITQKRRKNCHYTLINHSSRCSTLTSPCSYTKKSSDNMLAK